MMKDLQEELDRILSQPIEGRERLRPFGNELRELTRQYSATSREILEIVDYERVREQVPELSWSLYKYTATFFSNDEEPFLSPYIPPKDFVVVTPKVPALHSYMRTFIDATEVLGEIIWPAIESDEDDQSFNP